MEPERITAPVVRDKVVNHSALLVCAYADDDKFKSYHLDGAISFSEFTSNTDTMDKGKEIFFYCA